MTCCCCCTDVSTIYVTRKLFKLWCPSNCNVSRSMLRLCLLFCYIAWLSWLSRLCTCVLFACSQGTDWTVIISSARRLRQPRKATTTTETATTTLGMATVATTSFSFRRGNVLLGVSKQRRKRQTCQAQRETAGWERAREGERESAIDSARVCYDRMPRGRALFQLSRSTLSTWRNSADALPGGLGCPQVTSLSSVLCNISCNSLSQ